MTEILYCGFTLDQVETKFANQTDEHKSEIAQDLIVRIREIERRSDQIVMSDGLVLHVNAVKDLHWKALSLEQERDNLSKTVARLEADLAIAEPAKSAAIKSMRDSNAELRAVIDEKDKLLRLTPQDILDDAGGYPWMRDEVIRLKRVSALLLAANAEIARRPCSTPDRRTNSACDCCSHHWLYQEPLGAFDGRTFEEIR